MRAVIITPSERRKAERFEERVSGRAQADESEAAHFALAARLQSVEVGGAVDHALAVAHVQGRQRRGRHSPGP